MTANSNFFNKVNRAKICRGHDIEENCAVNYQFLQKLQNKAFSQFEGRNIFRMPTSF